MPGVFIILVSLLTSTLSYSMNQNLDAQKREVLVKRITAKEIAYFSEVGIILPHSVKAKDTDTYTACLEIEKKECIGYIIARRYGTTLYIQQLRIMTESDQELHIKKLIEAAQNHFKLIQEMPITSIKCSLKHSDSNRDLKAQLLELGFNQTE